MKTLLLTPSQPLGYELCKGTRHENIFHWLYIDKKEFKNLRTKTLLRKQKYQLKYLKQTWGFLLNPSSSNLIKPSRPLNFQLYVLTSL